MSLFHVDGKGRGETARTGQCPDRFHCRKQHPADWGCANGEIPRLSRPLERQAVLPRGLSRWRVVAILRITIRSLREGLLAHRHYVDLRSKGVPHRTAIEGAMGIVRPRT